MKNLSLAEFLKSLKNCKAVTTDDIIHAVIEQLAHVYGLENVRFMLKEMGLTIRWECGLITSNDDSAGE